MGNRFAVVAAPGYDDNTAELKVFSSHSTAEEATAAAGRHDYIEAGTHRKMHPCCAIKVAHDVEAGDVVWKDTPGRTAWEYVV